MTRFLICPGDGPAAMTEAARRNDIRRRPTILHFELKTGDAVGRSGLQLLVCRSEYICTVRA